MPPGMQGPPGMPPQGMPPGAPPGGGPQGPAGPMMNPMEGPMGQQQAEAAQGGVPAPGPGNPQFDLSQLIAQLAQHMVSAINTPGATQLFAAEKLMDTLRKVEKAKNSVSAMVPKMAATTPNAPPMGREDISALGQQAGQMAPGQMPPPQALQQLAMLGGH